MREFLFQYGLFLAKTLTIVIAAVFFVGAAAAASRKARAPGGLSVQSLNERYHDMVDTLRKAVLPKKAFKTEHKARKAQQKARAKETGDSGRPRTFVVDFRGDIKATAVAGLRNEISAVLSMADEQDEVLLRLENYGGMVHEHGLAAAQLARVREHRIPLIVAVDKAAASGGYLMACIADKIVAAPFAIIGSIGVLAQIPNFHGLLKEHGIKVEQLKAGRYKRTVTMFGENTDEDREKLREELEDVHVLFRQLVAEYRPDLDLERVATGEHWYGKRALELALVDEIGTSDDYLVARVDERDVYHVSWKGRMKFAEKVAAAVEDSGAAAVRGLARAYQQTRYGGG